MPRDDLRAKWWLERELASDHFGYEPPERPARDVVLGDVAGCGHPGDGDLCGDCLAYDERHYRGGI